MDENVEEQVQIVRQMRMVYPGTMCLTCLSVCGTLHKRFVMYCQTKMHTEREGEREREVLICLVTLTWYFATAYSQISKARTATHQ